MSLKDDLVKAQIKPKTKYEIWVDNLDQEDKEALLKYAKNQEISDQTLIRACAQNGYNVGAPQMSKWRKANGLAR